MAAAVAKTAARAEEMVAAVMVFEVAASAGTRVLGMAAAPRVPARHAVAWEDGRD